jgi:hypothetical protein
MRISAEHNTPTMTRFCAKCRTEIDERRVAQGSFYCSNACRDLDRRARRQRQADRYCRLCGRPKAKGRVKRVAANLKIDSRAAALGAHLATDNESDPVPVQSEELITGKN